MCDSVLDPITSWALPRQSVPADVEVDSPEQLGDLWISSESRSARLGRGAFFTPLRLAERILELALMGLTEFPTTVFDPSVGAGAFLLACLRRMVRSGVPPAEAARRLYGMELDPDTATVARVVLGLAFAEMGVRTPGFSIRRGDALECDIVGTGGPSGGFDLVIGNPPFGGQLRKRTARDSHRRARLRRRFGRRVHPYTEEAALFLLVASEVAAPSGRICLILPQSVLGSRDCAAIREHVSSKARMLACWTSGGERCFDADVDVCAPVFEMAGADTRAELGPDVAEKRSTRERRTVVVWRGCGPGAVGEAPAPALPDQWGLLSDVVARTPLQKEVHRTRPGCAAPTLRGAPTLGGARTLGEVARVTAGFRDEYYSITGAVREAEMEGEPGEDLLALVTCGLISPAVCEWGNRQVRFAGKTWHRPVVDVSRVNGRVSRWLRDRQRSKVLVATQTRIVEAAVDELGRWYPCTPVISVEPTGFEPPAEVGEGRRADLWSLAAALMAPPNAAALICRRGGTGIGGSVIRVTASDLRALPLPYDHCAWSEATRHLTEVHRAACRQDSVGMLRNLRYYADTSTWAYGGSDRELVDWWLGEARRALHVGH